LVPVVRARLQQEAFLALIQLSIPSRPRAVVVAEEAALEQAPDSAAVQVEGDRLLGETTRGAQATHLLFPQVKATMVVRLLI
jgi:hypothetical protein